MRARLRRLGYLSAQGDPGDFDLATDSAVRAFQQDRGINIDGIVGPTTFRHLEEARWRLGDRVLWFSAAHPHVGDDVADLQRRLADLGFGLGRIDGIFGPTTDAAVREFQRNVGMTADGTCGYSTVVALQRLSRAVRGGHPERLWDEHAHAANRTGIADKVIVLDPGHGGPATGAEARGLTEAVLADDLARRIEGRLAAIGTQVMLTRPPSQFVTSELSEEARATFANAVAADLVISLHVDASPSPRPHGIAAYYYGSPRSFSVLGEHFADVAVRELCRRTDMLDCGIHAKTWDLLRLTRGPAVRIETGYLTHAGDAARLRQPRFRDRLAEAIAAAAVAFYAPVTATTAVVGR